MTPSASSRELLMSVFENIKDSMLLNALNKVENFLGHPFLGSLYAIILDQAP